MSNGTSEGSQGEAGLPPAATYSTDLERSAAVASVPEARAALRKIAISAGMAAGAAAGQVVLAGLPMVLSSYSATLPLWAQIAIPALLAVGAGLQARLLQRVKELHAEAVVSALNTPAPGYQTLSESDIQQMYGEK